MPEATALAPTSKSLALVVVANPLSLVVPVPLATAVTSNGLVVLMPLYSAMRRSGNPTAPVNTTVTVLAPAEAEACLWRSR